MMRLDLVMCVSLSISVSSIRWNAESACVVHNKLRILKMIWTEQMESTL